MVIKKICTKGCPYVVLDGFLKSKLPDNTGVDAYADDIALVVRSNTGLGLKEKLQTAINNLIV